MIYNGPETNYGGVKRMSFPDRTHEIGKQRTQARALLLTSPTVFQSPAVLSRLAEISRIARGSQKITSREAKPLQLYWHYSV